MKLKVRFHPKPGFVVLAIVTVLAAFFIVRTAIWEIAYYNAKEGSARATTTTAQTGDTTAYIETPPTEQEVSEYFVADDYPRYLTITALGIEKARILEAGLTEDGAIATPVNIYDVAWYNGSSLPGKGGTVVIDGHNGADQKGVFKQLASLAVGSEIEIEVGGRSVPYRYRVVENISVPIAESDDYMATAFSSPVSGTESLTLISCTGQWLGSQSTYDHRVFVRAVKI